MFLTRFLVSLLEFGVTILLAVAVVFVTYRAMIKANTDFDEDEELRKGNFAAGPLVAALLLASANLIHKAFSPAIDALHVSLTGVARQTIEPWKLALSLAGSLFLSFALAIVSLSFSLRAFGRFTRNVKEGVELHKGNVAIGVVLSSVVLIVSMLVGNGVGSLTKTLTPSASVSRVQIMR